MIGPETGFEKKMVLIDDDVSIEFYFGGGHTSCSSYAYFPSEKVIVAGDLMFSHGFPYAGDPTCNPDIWITQLEDFLKTDFEKIIPGHGEVCDRIELETHLEFFIKLRKLIKEALLTNISIEEFEIPSFYPAEEWLHKSAKEKWFDFYK